MPARRLHLDPLLRARESCSDMVQSVCRECLQDLGAFEFRNEPAFRKWLLQKAQSKFVDKRRAKRASVAPSARRVAFHSSRRVCRLLIGRATRCCSRWKWPFRERRRVTCPR